MPPHISRRELLKNGAKAAAALSVCPALTREAQAQRRGGPARRALKLNLSTVVYHRTYMP